MKSTMPTSHPSLTLFVIFLAMLLSLPTVTAPAASPEDFLPPARPWAGASEALIVSPNDPWITPVEKSGMTESPSYDETVAWLRKLATASPLVKVVAFGRTAEGRELCAVIASKEGIAQLERLPGTGKPTVLVQAGIHSGEIDGKDAGMMLLRDIAVRGKAGLLDKANLLFIPVFNADGHERRSAWNRPNQRGPVQQGWRTTAQNLNLNRDYMKAQAPEMRAMLRLIQTTQPALYFDVHVTDGVDYQYDITYGFDGWDGSFAWSPRIGAWMDHTLRPAVDGDLKAAGHIPGPLIFTVSDRDLSLGLTAGPSNPRFSQRYGDLIHLPSVLVENHSLKPYRQRVLGTYVLLESALRTVGRGAIALQAAIAADRKARPELLAVNWDGKPDKQTTMDFLGMDYEEYVSPASGTKEIRWLGRPKTYANLPVHHLTRPGVTLRRPKAYYVPVTEPEMIAVLRSHGVEMERLAAPRTLKLDRYRLVDPVTSATPFEGRHTLATKVKSETASVTVPAGTMRVSTDQALGDLAIALLEPEHVDSLAAWGFVPEILQRTEYIEGYVIAPMAERMLAEDKALKAEFEAKLAKEPAFAKDPAARLEWFYQRSPFFDERYLLYPVLIER